MCEHFTQEAMTAQIVISVVVDETTIQLKYMHSVGIINFSDYLTDKCIMRQLLLVIYFGMNFVNSNTFPQIKLLRITSIMLMFT